jgi:hypothetical protein
MADVSTQEFEVTEVTWLNRAAGIAVVTVTVAPLSPLHHPVPVTLLVGPDGRHIISAGGPSYTASDGLSEAVDRWRSEQTGPASPENDIACSACGGDLIDINPHRRLATMPPKVWAECRDCHEQELVLASLRGRLAKP